MTIRGIHGCVLVVALAAACGRAVVSDFSGDGTSTPTIAADDCISWSNGVALPFDCDPATANTTGDGTVLACGRLEPTEVTVQGNNVYWAETDGIVAFVPLNGGPGHILQCSDGTVWHLASDAQSLYWTQQSAFTSATGTSGIFSLPLNGGQRTLLASSQEPIAIFRDGPQLLWADYSTNEVEAFDLASSVVSLLAANQSDILSLAVTSSAVYWVEFDSGRVMKLDLQPGAVPLVLATGQTQPVSIAVNAHGVFWENGGSMSSDGQIMRMNDVPGATPQVMATNESSPGSFVADDDALYWTVNSYNWRQDGEIRKLSMAPGAVPTTLAAGQGEPGQPVIAGNYLYWADLGPAGQLGGTIRRIAR